MYLIKASFVSFFKVRFQIVNILNHYINRSGWCKPISHPALTQDYLQALWLNYAKADFQNMPFVATKISTEKNVRNVRKNFTIFAYAFPFCVKLGFGKYKGLLYLTNQEELRPFRQLVPTPSLFVLQLNLQFPLHYPTRYSVVQYLKISML